MTVSAITGHGDGDVQALLPATVSPDRVALVGLHSWTDDDYPHVAEWGLGVEPHGLTSRQVRRVVADIDRAADVVGLTVAEFIPRQVMHLQQILEGLPLITGTARSSDDD